MTEYLTMSVDYNQTKDYIARSCAPAAVMEKKTIVSVIDREKMIGVESKKVDHGGER